MTVNESISMILHRIRVKLYPNYLPNAKGTYIARTNSEKTLSVEDVCTALKTRGGYDGEYGKLVDTVHKYLGEVAYQLCDGYAVNNSYYSIWPNIGGTFDSANELYDPKKHPIGFRFGIRSGLYRLLETIRIEVEGLADTNGFIDTFTDDEEQTVNGLYIAGNMFTVHGSRIKLEGSDESVGLYFVPVDDPGKAVKVNRIAKNSASEVTGISPKTGFKNNRVEIRTQFSRSGHPTNKNVRVLTGIFTLEEAGRE